MAIFSKTLGFIHPSQLAYQGCYNVVSVGRPCYAILHDAGNMQDDHLIHIRRYPSWRSNQKCQRTGRETSTFYNRSQLSAFNQFDIRSCHLHRSAQRALKRQWRPTPQHPIPSHRKSAQSLKHMHYRSPHFTRIFELSK